MIAFEFSRGAKLRAASARILFKLARAWNHRTPRQHLYNFACAAFTNRQTWWTLTVPRKFSQLTFEYPILERVKTNPHEPAVGF